jgi:hypothetical protein
MVLINRRNRNMPVTGTVRHGIPQKNKEHGPERTGTAGDPAPFS